MGFGRLGQTSHVPNRHRYKLEVIPEHGTTTEYNLNDQKSFETFDSLVPAVILSLPEIILKRITLSFKGATAQDQSELDDWLKKSLSASLPCSVTVDRQ